MKCRATPCNPECRVKCPSPGNSCSREFSFFWWYWKHLVLKKVSITGLNKIWWNRSRNNLVAKKLSESIPKKIWYRKSLGNSFRENLVPKKSQKWSWSDVWVSSLLQCLASTLCFLCLNFFLTSDFFSNNIWWEVENRQVEPGEGWRGRGGRVLIFEQEVFFNFWCQCLVGCFSPVWEHPPTYDRE